MEKAFNELNEWEKRAAIDIAVACTLLVTRLPELGPETFEHVADQFASQYGVSRNIAKYAFRELGRELFWTGWTMYLKKTIAGELESAFTPGEPIVDSAL